MQSEWEEKQKLIERLQESLSEFLCSDQESEEEKLARIAKAKAIFEKTEV